MMLCFIPFQVSVILLMTTGTVMKSDLSTSVSTDTSESSLISSINTMPLTGLELKAYFQTLTYICYLYYLEEIKEE